MLATDRVAAIKVVGIAILLFLAAFIVFRLPTTYLYFLLFAAGTGAFCMILYQLYRIVREDYVEPAPVVARGGKAPAPGLEAELPADERIVLEWARECLEAGNTLDAGVKLERIAGAHRNHPDVLRLRHEIYFAERRWHAALDVAKAWAQAAPDDPAAWEAEAACLGEMRLFQQAVNVLKPVAERFPKAQSPAYRLARFNAEMGRLEEAQRWLFRALDAGEKGRLVQRAMTDAALHPLLHFLGRRALVERIVTGGLTGAERAALEFAERHGIERIGWCPRGRSEEERRFHVKHGLLETASGGWQVCTDLNVQQADATVVFSTGGDLYGAAARALEFARQSRRPCLALERDNTEGDPVARLLTFLEQHRVRTLHVAGSIAAREPHIGEFVTRTLEAACDYQLRSLLHGTLASSSVRV